MRLPASLTAATALVLVAFPLSGQTAGAPRASESVRAVWVVRSSLTSPESIRSMIQRVSDGGFNTILVQVRGRGEAYYRSAIEPRSASLSGQPETFDPLALTIDLGHEAGLSVHAWINVNLVASAASLPRSAEHIARRHPEWLMVPRALARDLADSDPRSPEYVARLAAWARRASNNVEGLYLSPITFDAQAYSTSVIRDLVESYPVDGVHLDYVRYPSEAFDYSRTALAEFRASRLPFSLESEREDLDAATLKDPTAWTTNLPDSWAEFRRARLTELVERIGAAVREARPGVTISAAVVPDAAEARESRLQDWLGWTRDGLLDVVCPMAYTTDAALFSRQVRAIHESLNDVPIWAGIGAYRLSAGAAAAHVRLARQAGADGVVVFSYDSVAGQRDGGAQYFADLRPALLEDHPRPHIP